MLNNWWRRKDAAIAIEARRQERIEEAELRHKDKLEDWKRQDEVAKKVDNVAKTTKVVNEATLAQLGEIQNQNHQIHTLVNNNMTVEMRARLTATYDTLIVMEELISVKKAAGIAPSEAALKAIEQKKGIISELEASLNERVKQAAQVKEQEEARGAV